MAKPPLPPSQDDIGDETLAPVKWLVPRWPEIKFWIYTGVCAGVTIVSGLVAAAAAGKLELSGLIGGILGAISVFALVFGYVFIYFGRHARDLRLDEYKRKLEGWERQVRQDVKDSLSPDFEAKHKALDATIADLRAQSRDWQNEVVQLRTDLNEARTGLTKTVTERDKLQNDLKTEIAARRAAELHIANLKNQIEAVKRDDTIARADAVTRLLDTINKFGPK